MDSNRHELTRIWAIVAGVALVGLGLIGFIPDQAIASEDPDALFHTNTLHDVVHLLTGALALYIAFAVEGVRDRGNWLIAFGVLYGLVFVSMLVDPSMFGLMDDAPANMPLHVVHGILALGSLIVGYLGRTAVAGTDGRIDRLDERPVS